MSYTDDESEDREPNPPGDTSDVPDLPSLAEDVDAAEARALLDAGLEGDTDARRQLIRQLWEAARAGAWRALGPGASPEDVEDVIQSSLVAYVEQQQMVFTNPEGYIYRIAHRKGLRLARILRRDRSQHVQPTAEADPLQNVASPDPAADDRAASQRLLVRVVDHLNENLTNQEVEFFNLFHLQEKPAPVVADLMSITRSHARVVKHNVQKKAINFYLSLGKKPPDQ